MFQDQGKSLTQKKGIYHRIDEQGEEGLLHARISNMFV